MDKLYKIHFLTISKFLILLLVVLSFQSSGQNSVDNMIRLTESKSLILKWKDYSPYIADFNRNDDEIYVQYYPNSKADELSLIHIPYFNCPNQELEKTYYFRWWTFRKHIKETPAGLSLI